MLLYGYLQQHPLGALALLVKTIVVFMPVFGNTLSLIMNGKHGYET